jgi:hypothetical protein
MAVWDRSSTVARAKSGGFQDSTGDSTNRAFGTSLTRLTRGFKPKPHG